MRVGTNSPIDTQLENRIDANQNRAVETAANAADNFSQLQTGANIAASMKRAESGVDAGMKADQLRAILIPTLRGIIIALPRGFDRPAGETRSVTQESLMTSTGSAAPNSPINDNQTTTSQINISDDLSITGVKVNLDIAHTYRGDLEVKLRSPEGKEVLLHNRAGGSADNLVLEANPTDFNGLSSKGAWSLIVNDKAAQDTGTLKNWKLAVTGEPKAAPGVITKTATPNAAIRDNQTTTSTIDITDEGQIDNLKLNLDIAHTYRGDLVVKLTSPSGKEFNVSNRAGGSADNLVLTGADITANFPGESIKGTWKLTVQDAAAQDTGTLKSWGLEIKKKGGTPPPPPPPPPTGQTKLQVVGDATFRQRTAQDLAKFAPGTTVNDEGYVQEAANKVAGHDQGYALINQLLNNPNKVTIQFTPQNAFTSSGAGATVQTNGQPGAGSTATVAYDQALDITLPTVQADGTIRDEPISSEVVLAHELVHALHAQRGTIDRSLRDHVFTDGTTQYKENWRYEEFRTTGFTGFRQGNEPSENSIRAELGFRARATYLDRSSWTRVNGITANENAAAAGTVGIGGADLVGDPWRASMSCEGICTCFNVAMQRQAAQTSGVNA